MCHVSRQRQVTYSGRYGSLACLFATLFPHGRLRALALNLSLRLQLEALAGTLEDSFTATEHILSASPSSPRAMATLQAEKARRQHLLSQISKVCHVRQRCCNAVSCFCPHRSTMPLTIA